MERNQGASSRDSAELRCSAMTIDVPGGIQIQVPEGTVIRLPAQAQSREEQDPVPRVPSVLDRA